MGKKTFDLNAYIDSQPIPSEIHYAIDKEKRTIVAYMTNCKYDAMRAIEKINPSMVLNNTGAPAHYLINDTYRGKAICSENDEWDETIGKEVARNRMLFRYYGAKYNAFLEAINDWEEVLGRLVKKLQYCDMKATEALYLDEDEDEDIDTTYVDAICTDTDCPTYDTCIHGGMRA